MEFHDGDTSGFIDAFAKQRQHVLRHASRIIDTSDPQVLAVRPDAVPQLTGLVAASLEELKIAEEELLQQHEEMESTRQEMDRQLQHYPMLFDLAPPALLLTDRNSGIRDVNRAAVALLHRRPEHLEHKPLVGMIPRAERMAFRNALSRLTLMVGATNWRFVLERPTDVPLPVTAAVHVIPDGPTGTSLLWHLRPLQPGIDD